MHFLVLALPLLTQQFDECRYSAPHEANVDAASVTRLMVVAGSGSLEVVGKPGLRQARVKGKACASSRELLDDIKLSATRSGSEIRVNANDRDQNLRGREYARLDVVIEVPEGLVTEIEDGSGSIDLSGIGALTLMDGSGEITATDLRGDVDIEDGSGQINLRGVKGSIKIHDGSGEIDLRDVQGRVDIRDGSGEITLFKIARDVLIRDTSGSIDVDDVGGTFTVSNDSSGGIDYHGVKGEVNVPRKKRNDDGWRRSR